MANIIRIGGGGGSTPTLITKSITQNGTYNASSDNADGYSEVNVNVSGGGTAVTQFRYIKWHITANGGAGYFQVSELGFCDTADNIMTFPQGMSATSSLSLLSDYSISNLFDGSTNTKIVTEWHSGDIEDIIIDFGSGNEIDITDYPYYYWGSSDDDQTYSGRNPLKWQLLGANQSDFSDAVLLDEVTSFSPLVKNQEMAYRGLMVSPIQSSGGVSFNEVLSAGVISTDTWYATANFNDVSDYDYLYIRIYQSTPSNWCYVIPVSDIPTTGTISINFSTEDTGRNITCALGRTSLGSTYYGGSYNYIYADIVGSNAEPFS